MKINIGPRKNKTHPLEMFFITTWSLVCSLSFIFSIIGVLNYHLKISKVNIMISIVQMNIKCFEVVAKIILLFLIFFFVLIIPFLVIEVIKIIFKRFKKEQEISDGRNFGTENRKNISNIYD